MTGVQTCALPICFPVTIPVVAVSVMTIFPCCHEGLKKKKRKGFVGVDVIQRISDTSIFCSFLFQCVNDKRGVLILEGFDVCINLVFGSGESPMLGFGQSNDVISQLDRHRVK